MMKKFAPFFLLVLFQAACINQTMLPALDPLPSWNNTPVKEAIIRYVKQISDPRSVLYTDTAERIAVFDFDGTLMVEKPDYIQNVFKKAFPAFIYAPSVFDTLASAWFNTARHPRFKSLYKDCMYQPMLELFTFFEAHQIRSFICTGSDMDFIRILAGSACHIPPERVIGTSYHVRFDSASKDIVRTEKMNSECWKSGKPENIFLHIGKKTLIVIGNSDGDIPMIEYSGNPRHPPLRMILVHDDPEREYQYYEGAEEVLKTARRAHWIMISMKNDFKTVFPATATPR